MFVHRPRDVDRLTANSQDGYGVKAMIKKDNASRDTFSLGLGGMTAIASFVPVPAIRHDRLRQNQEVQAHNPRNAKWRIWMPKRFRVA